MIYVLNEYCPSCGQIDPWRKVSTRIINGVRTQYVRCRRCGAKETKKFVDKIPSAPQRGTIFAG